MQISRISSYKPRLFDDVLEKILKFYQKTERVWNMNVTVILIIDTLYFTGIKFI